MRPQGSLHQGVVLLLRLREVAQRTQWVGRYPFGGAFVEGGNAGAPESPSGIFFWIPEGGGGFFGGVQFQITHSLTRTKQHNKVFLFFHFSGPQFLGFAFAIPPRQGTLPACGRTMEYPSSSSPAGLKNILIAKSGSVPKPGAVHDEDA